MEEGPYKLIAEIHAHDGPVRSLCIGPLGEIFSGCQSNSPTARRWSMNYENQIDGINVKVDEIGNAIFHDHWITAVAALPANPVSVLPKGCLVTGCMDNIIRIYDTIGNPLMNLEGHTKGIISFSWSIEGYLLSGSWDGTAKVWDLNTGLCLFTLGDQENGVHVLGCNNGHIATVSTGESVNSKPANFKLRIWDISSSNSAKIVNTYDDHEGSIRSITSINVGGLDGFATTSNDGSVRLHTLDGVNIGSMYHSIQINGEEGLPFVLNW
jgi:phospholipase A-2-activating protein